MCINRWREFNPTDKYLSIINELNTVEKLRNYIEKIEYTPDKMLWDKWQTPVETLERGKGDCEDFAIFAVDVLVRVVKIIEARFIAYIGTYIGQGHSVCVFPYKDKLHVFSNNDLVAYGKDYIDIGHLFFDDGLKYMGIRDYKGNVLQRKIKIFGTF